MERVNLLALNVSTDPYPTYAALRRDTPVCQVDPGGLWLVTRYDDVSSVLKDTETFSSGGLSILAVPPWLERNPISESLLLIDPPRHTKTRALVNRAFGAAVISQIEPLARRVVARAVEAIRGGQVVDFCEVLATPLPAAVILDLMGLDPSLQADLKRWSQDIASVHPDATPEVRASVHKTVAELERCVLEVVTARRKEPRDDLLTTLISARIDGVALTDVELVGFMFLLLGAGFETTALLLTNVMQFLARHPDVHDRVRSNTDLIPALIEEVLRLEGPIQVTTRLTTRDTEIAGVPIPGGSIVAAHLGAANRDERRFERPDQLDLDRPRQGIAFGYGVHACLGAALARAEVRFALEGLLALPGHFEEVPQQEAVWTASLMSRGLRTYRIRHRQ